MFLPSPANQGKRKMAVLELLGCAMRRELPRAHTSQAVSGTLILQECGRGVISVSEKPCETNAWPRVHQEHSKECASLIIFPSRVVATNGFLMKAAGPLAVTKNRETEKDEK